MVGNGCRQLMQAEVVRSAQALGDPGGGYMHMSAAMCAHFPVVHVVPRSAASAPSHWPHRAPALACVCLVQLQLMSNVAWCGTS